MVVTTRSPTRAQKRGEAERVYLTLREWLITARLAPGDFLSEADLAVRCRTSRTPIREACNRLAQDKWLSLIRHKGYLVSTITVRDIVELYDYRKLLECFTAAKVAASASAGDLAGLESILAAETTPGAEPREITAANARFHLRLAELAGNQRVIDQLSLTLGYVRRLDTLCTQSVPGWIGHGEIMRELAASNAEGARQAMAAHIDLSREKMVKLFGS